MGKLITIVGNSGVGKSTLAKNLCDAASFFPILEKMEERPFIWKFHQNRKEFALANQVDYFLFQAEQEKLIRKNDGIGVQDSGLDQAFHVFSKRFHDKGYLGDDEYLLCKRLYETLRHFLPSPDLIIHLYAPYSIIAERMEKRQRSLDIERTQDLHALGIIIKEWLPTIKTVPIIQVNAEHADPSYSTIMDGLIADIHTKLKLI